MSDPLSIKRGPGSSGVSMVRVWGRGQFTIPSAMRRRLGIGEDTILEVFQAGRAIVATPERITVKALAASVQNGMTEYGIDLEELLSELREGSHEYDTD
ncbi:MAG: AbrB/MazE/SpoVT family DNA-binding domain-containing protein [Peptococcaceae bacterium]|jgi:bifunctional DNA-binding transcriptional regulator/antitoxin component of YhaV-PrlF toxin-antitoxin module|nr:AbrB/MazE/SpoVT family DNA-binding domain-containing protein [Peptococcaceae bacterium]